MNINATLFAQAIVFAILVWFTMKFVWPPIAKALDERALKISEGLASAEKDRRTKGKSTPERSISSRWSNAASAPIWMARLATANWACVSTSGQCTQLLKASS